MSRYTQEQFDISFIIVPHLGKQKTIPGSNSDDATKFPLRWNVYWETLRRVDRDDQARRGWSFLEAGKDMEHLIGLPSTKLTYPPNKAYLKMICFFVGSFKLMLFSTEVERHRWWKDQILHLYSMNISNVWQTKVSGYSYGCFRK